MNKLSIIVSILVLVFISSEASYAANLVAQKQQVDENKKPTQVTVDDIKMIFLNQCKRTSGCAFKRVQDFDAYTRWQADQLKKRGPRSVSLDQLYKAAAEIQNSKRLK